MLIFSRNGVTGEGESGITFAVTYDPVSQMRLVNSRNGGGVALSLALWTPWDQAARSLVAGAVGRLVLTGFKTQQRWVNAGWHDGETALRNEAAARGVPLYDDAERLEEAVRRMKRSWG